MNVAGTIRISKWFSGEGNKQKLIILDAENIKRKRFKIPKMRFFSLHYSVPYILWIWPCYVPSHDSCKTDNSQERASPKIDLSTISN